MSPKIAQKFYCKICDYTSRNKYDFNKHLSTTKHQNGNKMVTNGNIDGNMLLKNQCKNCGKVYKYRSGLSRHRKNCSHTAPHVVLKKSRQKSPKVAAPSSREETNAKILKVLTKTLTQQGELMEKLVNSHRAMIPRIGNNNNNKISVNVFLNEHCKDAMNLTDFINNIKISLEDLEYTNAHGYVKGISNIFTKNLTDMEATQRPIHCSDKKRLQFYIKDENKWEKDKDNVKIDRGIQNITKKQILELKQWEQAHPDYQSDNKLYFEWQTMVRKLTGGGSIEIQAKNEENIKKTISNALSIKDALEIK